MLRIVTTALFLVWIYCDSTAQTNNLLVLEKAALIFFFIAAVISLICLSMAHAVAVAATTVNYQLQLKNTPAYTINKRSILELAEEAVKEKWPGVELLYSK